MFQLSEEHLARANEPLGDYYFLFEDEEKKATLCGIATPRPYLSTSNRLRLNFTSNSKINAKGFRAEWAASQLKSIQRKAEELQNVEESSR